MMRFFRKCQLIVMLALIAMPLVLLSGALWYTHKLWLCAALPAFYVVLACLCLPLRGKARLPVGLLLCALMVLFSLALTPWRTAWQALLPPAALAVLLLFSLPIAGWPAGQELPFNVTITGVGVYLLAQFITSLQTKLDFQPIVPALTGCFVCYGVLLMFSLNRQSLTAGAARGSGVPVATRRKNHLLTAGFTAIILLVAAIPALARLVHAAWRKIMSLVLRIVRWLTSLLPQQTSGGGMGGGGGMDMLPAEASEPSLVAVILEKVMIFIAVAAGAVLLFFALRIVWRKLRVLLGRLWTLLGRYAQSASEDYVDEIADTRSEGEAPSATPRRWLRRLMRQVNEDSLTPAERIRYRYGRLLWKRSDWQPASTARENLPAEAAQLYERARYSSQPVSADDAQTFLLHIKEMEKPARRS